MSLIEVVDQYGNPTGELITREQWFAWWILKRCSWVVFICQDRGILFQKRAQKKRVFPWMWDFTAAGHIDPGETPVSAALREAQEEINIKLSESDLHFQAMFAQMMILPDGWINNELWYLYIVDWTNKEDTFTLQEEEVECMKWFTFQELKEKFLNWWWPPDFVPHKRIFPSLLFLSHDLLRDKL